jgi:hypothetical protein
MQLIFLYTPQHTGTHFCRMLLESHPEVAPCIYGGMLPRWPYVDFFNGREGLAPWHGAVGAQGESRSKALKKRIRSHFSEFNISVAAKNKPRYLFYHDHISPVHHRSLISPEHPSFGEIKTIVTIRDPLLAALSALRRNNTGIINAASIFEGLYFAAKMRDAFFFCTDLWQNVPEQMLTVFEFLGLDPVEASHSYIARRPTINVTLRDDELAANASPGIKTGQFARENRIANRFAPALTSQRLAELSEARRLLQQEGRVHPLLEPWVDVLRSEPEYERFYKRLGYRDLLWFKND